MQTKSHLTPNDDAGDGADNLRPEEPTPFPVGKRFRGLLPADAERSQVGRKVFSSRPRFAGFALCGAPVQEGDTLTVRGHTNECQLGRAALRGLELGMDPLEILVWVEYERVGQFPLGQEVKELQRCIRKPDGTPYPASSISKALDALRSVTWGGNYTGMCEQGRVVLQGLREGRGVDELREYVWPGSHQL